MERLYVGKRAIGPSDPVYVIAEAGVNHNGDLALAHRLVDAAADARADAVKFQTWSTSDMMVKGAPKAPYQSESTGPGSMDEMESALELSPQAHRELAAHAKAREIEFLSSPFGAAEVALLVSLGVPALKVASGEITNVPLLRAVARTRLPVLLSTGMSDLGEVAFALETLSAAGSGWIALLHCVSAYPAAPQDANLRAMGTLASAFRLPVGWSDHTVGFEVAWAAVAMGACVLERHLTLDRALPGPDHRASTEPDDFRRLIEGVRTVEAARGDGVKRPRPCEIPVREVARRSLVTARDLPEGYVLRAEDLRVKRPGTGIAPALVDAVVGRRLARAVTGDTVLVWNLLT